MFSATAVPHSYSLDEVQTDNADDVEEKTAGYSYVLKKTAPQVTETGKTQTYTFAFENTITGTTGHIAYKYWKDFGISSDSRPDLYMNLYRYLKKDLSIRNIRIRSGHPNLRNLRKASNWKQATTGKSPSLICRSLTNPEMSTVMYSKKK